MRSSGYRVVVTELAQADAEEYASFIFEQSGSRSAATKWLDVLEAEMTKLKDSANALDVMPEAEDLGKPLRSFNYHSHRVIFEIDVVAQTVTILRIYHGARQPLEGPEVWKD